MTAGGFVLTGGSSRRMGRDKATLPYRGFTLVESVAAEVRAAAGNVTLVGAPERYAHLGIPVMTEDFPDCGPMSGVEAALRQTFAPWNLIVACDMPGIRHEWLADLLHFAALHPAAKAVAPVSPDGRLHPLCAVWHAGAQGLLRASLEAGKFKLVNALEEIGFVRYRPEWAALLRNVNTPEEWEASASA